MKQKNYIRIKGAITGIEIRKQSINYHVITDEGRGIKEHLVFSQISPSRTNVKDIPFNVKDRVTIEAHVQDRVTRDDDGNRKYQKTYVIDKIEHTKRIIAEELDDMSFGTTGGYPKDENHVLVVGKVYHVYQPSSNLVILTVIPSVDGHVNHCDITCYDRQAVTAASIEKGDYVIIVGFLKEYINKKTNETTQGIICRDIAKVDASKIEE